LFKSAGNVECQMGQKGQIENKLFVFFYE